MPHTFCFEAWRAKRKSLPSKLIEKERTGVDIIEFAYAKGRLVKQVAFKPRSGERW
jgi:hypothetical protein